MNTEEKMGCSASEKVPMLHRLLNYRYSTTNDKMPDNDIISEHMGHMWVSLS